MDDRDVLARIDALVAEEHELRDHAVGRGLDDAERERLSVLEEQLDRYWDLLRQRRAREEAGQDPDTAGPRPVDEVEDYEQ